MNYEQANYIAEYIKEEISRKKATSAAAVYDCIDAETIMHAVEAYEGGAR